MRKTNIAIIVAAVVVSLAVIVFTVCAVSMINRSDENATTAQPVQQATTEEKTTEPVTQATTEYTTQPKQEYNDSKDDYSESAEKATTEKFVPSDSSIKLTSSLQYNVNIYLSNFSEVGMKSFSGRPSDEELANFGLMYNFINRHEKTTEFGEYDVPLGYGFFANVRIKESYIIESIKKFLGITVQPGFAQGVGFYKDGYFYTEFTGAPMTDGFTVVSELTDEGGGVYKATFSIYDAGGADSKYYSYSASQIENESGGCLAKAGSGTAYFTSDNLSDRTTYRLTDYKVSRGGQ